MAAFTTQLFLLIYPNGIGFTKEHKVIELMVMIINEIMIFWNYQEAEVPQKSTTQLSVRT